MPVVTSPVIPAGRFRQAEQPRIVVDAELSLRPWRDQDAPSVLAAYRDADIQRWHARTLADEQEAQQLLSGWRYLWAAETGAGWAVASQADQLLGRIALCAVNLHEAVAALAYWTAPEARGHGVAPRAVRGLIRWAMDVVGFHRLELQHATRETVSRVADRDQDLAVSVVRATLSVNSGLSSGHRDGFGSR